ncbi:MAG: hypothetical protein V6Z89_23770 [Desulfobacter sp.]
MIGTIEGQLVATKIRYPEGIQKLKPHQLLSVLQVCDDEANIVKVKDMNLSRKYKENTRIKFLCRISHCSTNNVSEQGVTLMEVL